MSRKRRPHDRGHADFGGGPDKPPGDVVTPPPATPGVDVNLRAIVRFGVGLALAAVCVSALLLVYLQILARRARVHDPSPTAAVPAWEQEDDEGTSLRKPEGGVSLQRQPFRDIEELRKQETELLSKYAWIDESTGAVRIPIDAAMRLLVRRGLPVRASGPGVAPVPPPVMAGATAATPVPTPSPRPRRRPRPRPADGAPDASPAVTPSAPEAPAPKTEPAWAEVVRRKL